MKHMWMLAGLLTLSCSGGGNAEANDARQSLAIVQPEARTSVTIALSSPAFASGERIPLRFSAYGEGVSPPLAWSEPPAGTKSLALFMEDPDAVSAKPYVHWLIWNIDPAHAGLEEGIVPSTARQGKNTQGTEQYFGPRPHGAKAHNYHFQIFALDIAPGPEAGAKRADLLRAMNGHVLAKGELIGLFAQP